METIEKMAEEYSLRTCKTDCVFYGTPECKKETCVFRKDDLKTYTEIAQEQRAAMVKEIDELLRRRLPRVIADCPFGDGTVDLLNEDLREDIRKALEG